MHTDGTRQLQALHADLELLKNALQDEDHAAAEQLVAGHDRRLRDYLQQHGTGADPQALYTLLEQQRAMTHQLRELRDEASRQLRLERQSTQAANAYQQAGTLA